MHAYDLPPITGNGVLDIIFGSSDKSGVCKALPLPLPLLLKQSKLPPKEGNEMLVFPNSSSSEYMGGLGFLCGAEGNTFAEVARAMLRAHCRSEGGAVVVDDTVFVGCWGGKMNTGESC